MPREKEKLIATGAEAVIIKEENSIIKRRIKKSYRIKEIDERLRKLRTRSEGKIMDKLSGIINVPKIIKIDEKSKEIIMELIKGKKLSDNLDSFSLNKQEEICKEIGKEVSKIHNQNIIHGDLTTSNMILVESEKRQEKTHNHDDNNSPTTKNHSQNVKDLLITNKKTIFNIFFIDFGLGFISSRVEDKAVDLHLLRQALESRHFQHWQKLFKITLDNYNPQDKEKILKQLEKVELRGRYRKNAH